MDEFIFYNGDILTMEEDGGGISAVYVKDGRIAAAGAKAEVERFAGTGVKRIDLEGKTLLPSFIDPHGHFTGYANSLLQIPLEEAVTFEEIADRIRKFIVQNKIAPGVWILGKGYDQNSLPGKCHPPKEVLDNAAPENPVVIQHASGHMGVFNSLGLKMLNITQDTECPEGGRIELKNDELTGYLEEAVFVKYVKQVPMPSMDDLMDAFRKVQDRYAAFGITTVQEGMMPDMMSGIYHQLLDREILKLDVVGYVDSASTGKLFDEFECRRGQYDRHFRLGGYKTFLDGSPQDGRHG